jgi:hypothetical protein
MMRSELSRYLDKETPNISPFVDIAFKKNCVITLFDNVSFKAKDLTAVKHYNHPNVIGQGYRLDICVPGALSVTVQDERFQNVHYDAIIKFLNFILRSN